MHGRGQVFLDFCDGLLDFSRHAAEIAAVDIGCDIDHPLDGVMVDRVHARSGPHIGDVGNARHLRSRHGCRRGDSIRRGDVRSARRRRQIEDVLDGRNLVDRDLHGNDVVHAVLRIEEVGRANERARGQRCQQVIGDIALRHAKPCGALSIHVDLQRRVVHHLRNVAVHHAGNFTQRGQELLSGRVGAREIRIRDLDIDRRRKTEVEHLADDIGGLEVEGRARIVLGQPVTDQPLIFHGRLVR